MDMTYIFTILPQMWFGALESLKIFGLVAMLSIPLGLLMALGRINGFDFIKKLLAVYVWVLRGSPLMLQMLFVYFALPTMGIYFEDFTAAMIAFVLNYAAYFCEIFRSGFQAIPKGQFEAAHVLGMGYWQTLRRIIFPQVLRIVLPPMSNEIITLVKDTSLVYVLAMNDLMRTTRNLVQRDFSIVPFIVAVVFYLGATLLLTIFFNRLEKHFSKSSR